MSRGSRSSSQLDDWQMLATFDVAHVEHELVAATAASRSVRPLGSRFESPSSPVATRPDFVRCLSGKPHVRTSGVVPDRIQMKLTTHRCEGHRDQQTSRALLLHRSNESFDDGDAGWLADATITRTNAPPLAPRLETATPELLALVTDDTPGRGTARSNGPCEKALEFYRRGNA